MKYLDHPFKTVFETRSPKAKAHLNFGDVRRALAVATDTHGRLREDVQVYEWGIDHRWTLMHDLKKGDELPWKQQSQ